ncbi:MAG: tetratricopeptide repeat protein [Nitrospirae bacterium]|nr:tetratricopeptide repeat protein [Nitrospirota bacterium]
MPKPIKKRKRKKHITEEEVYSFLETCRDYYENNKRFVHLLVVAMLSLVVIVVFTTYYFKDRAKKAYALEYEGYKYYHKLYDASALSDDEALNKALEKFQLAYKKKPEAISLYYIALVQLKKGQDDKALKSLETLVKKFPRNKELTALSLYEIAQIQIRKGNRESALRNLEKMYALSSPYFKDLALYESARLLESMNKTEEALKKYSLIVERYPSSPYFSIARSKIEEKKKKEDKKESSNKKKKTK